MKDSLEELKFNFDTVVYLKNLGWSHTKMMEYFVNKLNYPSGTVTALLTTKASYLNSVFKRLDLYVELKLSNDEVKMHMLRYHNLAPLVNYLLDTDEVIEDEAETGDVEVEVEVEVEEEVEEAVVSGVEENDDEEEENLFDEFLKQNVNETNDDSDKMKSSQVYSKFKSWYSSQYDEDVPSKAELKSFLNDKFGKSVKSAWSGVSLK
jgi:hypothetical protein